MENEKFRFHGMDSLLSVPIDSKKYKYYADLDWPINELVKGHGQAFKFITLDPANKLPEAKKFRPALYSGSNILEMTRKCYKKEQHNYESQSVEAYPLDPAVNPPVFPVAYLLHESKHAEVHEYFWNTMKKLLPLDPLPPGVVVVTDREAGLIKGLRKAIESIDIPEEDEWDSKDLTFHHALCSIHIKRDVKQWIKDSKGHSSVDLKVLCKIIDDLLNCETEEEFEEHYSNCEERWSQDFKTYMNSSVKKDMKLAAWFYTKQFPAFADELVTSNFTESWNAILKRAVEWKRLRFDNLVMVLFNLTMYYLGEFHRAYHSLGNFQPKPEFMRKGPRFRLPEYTFWPEDKLLEKFNENYSACVRKSESASVTGNKALARLACEIGYISLNPQTVSYTVTHPYDRTISVVTEDDSGALICTCGHNSLCFHKEAYLRVTRKNFEEGQLEWHLNVIRKKTRNYKGPAGTKKVRQIDLKDVVGPADCDLRRKQDGLDSFGEDEDKIAGGNDAGGNDAAKNKGGKEKARKMKTKSSVDKSTGDLRTKQDTMATIGEDESNETKANNTFEVDEDTVGTCPAGTDGMFLTQSDVPGQDVLKDPYDYEDKVGLHYYPYPENQRHKDEGMQENGSAISSSNGETPEYFVLPVEDIKVDRKHFMGTLRCLLPDRELFTDVVDDMIALMIKIHGLNQKITFATSTDYLNASLRTVDSIKKVCAWAMSGQALNADIVLVDIHIRSPPHFLLGVIIWSTQDVVILNSLPSCPQNYAPIFETLYRILLASQVVAGAYIDLSKWSNWVETDVEHQKDGVSCGVYTALNAYSICARAPYFTSTDGISLTTVRHWIVKCLVHPEVHRPVEMRKPGSLVKLSPKEKEMYAKRTLVVYSSYHGVGRSSHQNNH